jgi:hypothetical protein
MLTSQSLTHNPALWSEWHPLRGIGTMRAVSSLRGLYHIRRVGPIRVGYMAAASTTITATT